jgi:hypothetical protein
VRSEGRPNRRGWACCPRRHGHAHSSSTSLQCTARSPLGPRIADSIRIEGCTTATGAKASTIIATIASVRNVHGAAVDHDCDQHHRGQEERALSRDVTARQQQIERGRTLAARRDNLKGTIAALEKRLSGMPAEPELA